MRLYIYIYMCVCCVYICVNAHMCVLLMCICVHAHLYMFLFSCVCVCFYVYIYIFKYAFVYLHTISYGFTIILHVPKKLSGFYSMLLIVPLQCVLKSGIYCHQVKNEKLQIYSSFPRILVFIWGVLFVTLSYYIGQREWK